jgi:cytidylate kinase
MEHKSVALDGPAAAGKSTLAMRAAKRFGLIYVDTGALYRCVGLYALRKGVASRDEVGVVKLLPEIKLEMMYDEDGIQRMLLCGEDVTDSIRIPEASTYASDVSAMPPVREFLLSMQRGMGEKYDVIMDGRDIGTVVMPGAGLKIFITADPGTRAKRRYLELVERNIATTLEEVERDMVARDKNDSEREAAPLKAADDAVILDTTNMGLEESYEAVCGLISWRFKI